MARAAFLLALALAFTGQAAGAREAVWASETQAVSVTVYRDPHRQTGDTVNRDWPQGFALISETRNVTLPPGESTIRFDGVAEGMIAVSAIVTGLPGGTIEKNRNADLLSPAALVDGTLGNRVTITRTNPATGAQVAEDAIVRTRADGGLVLQTPGGYEAVRCSGLPEKLTFDRLPDGLSARPVFSIDTRDASGGTYEIVLTYLSWGFDWEANYVANFDAQRRDGTERLAMQSWLTLVNDNGQSFENAGLNVVAGALSIVSDFQQLAAPPVANGLYLQCYPLGSTAAGSPVVRYESYGLAGAPPPMPDDGSIMVTAQRMRSADYETNSPIVAVDAIASEEQLGDLKLYRVPQPVTVAAKSMKQVAFLDKNAVEGRLFYHGNCTAGDSDENPWAMRIVLETKNDEEHGLGVALPMGAVRMFEHGLLVGEDGLRDHAEGQEVKIAVADSAQVFATCSQTSGVNPYDDAYPWVPMRATVTNANPRPVTIKLKLGSSAFWRLGEKLRGLAVEDGQWTLTRTIPANRAQDFSWTTRYFAGEDEK